jgi:hypothetical protein
MVGIGQAGNGRSDQSRPFQFSLRALLMLMTVIGVLLGAFDPYSAYHVFVVASLVVLFLTMCIVGLLAANAALPSRTMVALALIASFGVAFVASSLLGSHQAFQQRWLVIAAPASFPAWVVAWVLWRVVRRTPGEFARQEVRWAARATMLMQLSLYGFTVFVFLRNVGVDRDGGPVDLHSAVTYYAAGATLTGVLPWVYLVRRHARGSAPRVGRIDAIAQMCLWTSLGLALLSLAGASYLYYHRSTMLSYGYLGAVTWFYGLHCAYPLLQVGSTCGFLCGLAIELWCDKWNRVSTAVACGYFIPYWLVVALWPVVLQLA